MKEIEVLKDNSSKGAPTEYDLIRLKLKEGKEELTETEREALRVKRRERRKREKENKKKEKEKRSQMLAPQTSKLHMVTRATLAQMMSPVPEPKVTGQPKTEKGIKFEDEEYPDLSSRPAVMRNEKVISKEIRDEKGRLCQDRESNSEWETEEEKEEYEEEVGVETMVGGEQISVVSDSGPLSYSSILKAKKIESLP